MTETTPLPRDEAGAHLEALAARLGTELAGRATLERVTPEDHPGGRSVVIRPRHPAAASVTWVETAEFLSVEVGGHSQRRGHWDLDRTSLDAVFLADIVDAAVRGHVVEVSAPGRSRMEITFPDGEVIVTTTSQVPAGCLPIPGWVRRGKRIQYAPH
ncbi:hypothetical protein [Georgenia faecalis]|uniref:Uncharacterized protein n=1 Tax=Georgenia faecalis TaxID=2483799 RepID=A0ABV9DB13_9MICO|nr:hypothetical protein [Georgenia faecalis]